MRKDWGGDADDQSIGQIRRPTFLPQQATEEVAEEDGYEDYGSVAGGMPIVGGANGDRNEEHDTRSQTSVLSSQKGMQSGWGAAPRATRVKSGPYGGTITPGAATPNSEMRSGRRTWAEQTEAEDAHKASGVITPHIAGERTTNLERMMQEMAKDQVEFKAQVNQERLHASKMHDEVVATMNAMQATMMMKLTQAIEGMATQIAVIGQRDRSEPRRADRRGREAARNTRELSEITDSTDNARKQTRSEGPTQRRRRTQTDEVMSVSDASDSD